MDVKPDCHNKELQ